MADSTLFPSLPAPIEFQQQEGLLDATGAKVRVAQLLATGPYFLEDLAHQKLMSWARGHPGPAAADHKLLVLTGPIKSGKSTMLNDVLPGVLAAQHAAAGGPKPVFFHFSFTLGMGPRAAALKMAQDAGTFAKDLGFEINGVPATEELALTNLPSVIRSLAAGIAKGGGELVVLVDEAQVSRRPWVLNGARSRLLAGCSLPRAHGCPRCAPSRGLCTPAGAHHRHSGVR